MAQQAHLESISLPKNVKDALLSKLPEAEIATWAIEAMVVEAVREHFISRNKAATLLGFEDYESRDEFFERHELFNEYTLEMLEQDLKAIDKIRG